ncbi:MAG: FAD-dependent oxidoreductase [Solirubrobacteraceae bacterium]
MTTDAAFNVVIAGGGVAALEAALALRDLAQDRVSIRLVAPDAEFTYRPMTVGEPFALPAARRYPLEDIAREVDAEMIVDELSRVDVVGRTAHTRDGDTLAYDALLIATGGRMRPPFAHGLTIDDGRMDELLHGIIQDVEGGYLRTLAFVAPERMAWPLPIYELALLTARRAYDMNVPLGITVVTPESAPLAIFGDQASQAVARLLDRAAITTIHSARAQVPTPGHVVIQPGDRSLTVDCVITLPELFGPAVRGLPVGAHGFLRVDAHGRVRGVPCVFAAGDGTDFPIKHGSIAAQQADAAAQSIAALAGAPLVPAPFHPRLHAMLLTGEKPLYLTAQISGGRGFDSEIGDEPTWEPAAKITAAYLTPFLARSETPAVI